MAIIPTSNLGNEVRPRVVTTVPELRASIAGLRHTKKQIGLVPTIGLAPRTHEPGPGLSQRMLCHDCHHLRQSNSICTKRGFREVSRTVEADLDMLAAEQVDLVFMPSPEQMYPKGSSTSIEPPAVAAPLEGVLPSWALPRCRDDRHEIISTGSRGCGVFWPKRLSAMPRD